MEKEKKSAAVSYVGAWAMNVVSSVGIIMANKQLMSPVGYAFCFGNTTFIFQIMTNPLLYFYLSVSNIKSQLMITNCVGSRMVLRFRDLCKIQKIINNVILQFLQDDAMAVIPLQVSIICSICKGNVFCPDVVRIFINFDVEYLLQLVDILYVIDRFFVG